MSQCNQNQNYVLQDPKSAEVTLLPLYANPSVLNVTNTSIIYKALGASNYSSKKQHYVDVNKLLANEIMDKFLGPMPSDLFLKWYFSLDKPNMKCSKSKWPKICKEMKEVEIYLLFVSSISTLVSQPMIKCNQGCNCELHKYT